MDRVIDIIHENSWTIPPHLSFHLKDYLLQSTRDILIADDSSPDTLSWIDSSSGNLSLKAAWHLLQTRAIDLPWIGLIWNKYVNTHDINIPFLSSEFHRYPTTGTGFHCRDTEVPITNTKEEKDFRFLSLSLRSKMDLDPRQYEHVDINENDVHSIVLSYLVHDCFKETAETFIACTGMKQPADYLIDMEKRKSIFHFALEGHALKAIELTEQLAHGLLEENKDLHFDLLSLHFVELVCSRKCTEALEFAQTKLTPFVKVQKYVEKLEDLMALLAYEEPGKSPMFHLLGLEYRQSVVDSLNRAILGWAATIFIEYLSPELNDDAFRTCCQYATMVCSIVSHHFGSSIASGAGFHKWKRKEWHGLHK